MAKQTPAAEEKQDLSGQEDRSALRTKKRKVFPGMSSIAVRIVLIFLAVMAPVYILLLISARAYFQSLTEQAERNVGSILQTNLTRLDLELARIDRYFYDLQENNTDYARLLRWQGTDEDRLALFSINRRLITDNGISVYPEAYYLYLEAEDELLLVNRFLTSTEKRSLQDSMKHSYYIRQTLRWNINEINGVPCLFHTVGYAGVYLGALVDIEAFMSSVREQIPYKQVEISLEYRFQSAADKAPAVSGEVHGTKQYVVIRLDRDEINNAMPDISRLILIGGSVFFLLFPIILIFCFMWMIVRPMRRIEEGIWQLGSGHQDYRIPEFKSSREFMGMRESFNTMAGEIQTLRIKSYEEQLERERMMLQNLLLQIRPHFLLNFFNQIYSMAELEDYTGIKKSSRYLTKFFRHLFRSERIATFRSELALVDDYLELMDERFLDCFGVERDIDESLLEYRIPPLIVQNFVENIFKYAVSEGNYIQIGLSLRKEDSYVVMTIADDGPGMEEEILEKIREEKPIEKEDGTHIGIFNSAYRLKRLCGEDCRLDVRSVLTEGTTVRIMLPLAAEDSTMTK